MEFLSFETKIEKKWWYKTTKIQLLLKATLYLRRDDLAWKRFPINLINEYPNISKEFYFKPDTLKGIKSKEGGLIILS